MCHSDHRVIGPLQQGLTLAFSAHDIARITVCPDLPGVSRKGTPTFDLDPVGFWQTAPQKIPTIPLKPSPGVRPVNPPLFAPYTDRLTAFDAEIVHFNIGFVTDLGVCEPLGREFCRAVIAVFPFEHAHFKHLFGGQIGRKTGRKILSAWGLQRVAVPGLHLVVHYDHVADRHGWVLSYPFLTLRLSNAVKRQGLTKDLPKTWTCAIG